MFSALKYLSRLYNAYFLSLLRVAIITNASANLGIVCRTEVLDSNCPGGTKLLHSITAKKRTSGFTTFIYKVLKNYNIHILQ